jgi:hypothetical protein
MTILTPTHSNRFDYVKYDDAAQAKQLQAKMMMQNMETWAVTFLPAGRPQSLVLTKLEEAYMWIGKAIRDEQVALRAAELQEERGDE